MSQQPSLRQLDLILDSEEIMSMLLLDFDNNNSSSHDIFFDQFLRSQTEMEDANKTGYIESSSSAQGMVFPEMKLEVGYYDQQQGPNYQIPMQSDEGLQYTNGMFSTSIVEEGSRDDSDNHVSRKGSSKSSKKRPRENMDDLEARVKELQTENADLHAHLLNVTQRTTEVQRQRAEMERQMVLRLSSGRDTDVEELSAIVKRYTDIYADYGKCRQREVSVASVQSACCFSKLFMFCRLHFICNNLKSLLFRQRLQRCVYGPYNKTNHSIRKISRQCLIYYQKS